MEQVNPKAQRIALILIVLAVALVAGSWLYSQKGSGSSQKPQVQMGQTQAGGMGAGPMGPGSMGGPGGGGGSPVQQAGTLLGAEVYAGHFPTKSGQQSVGLTAVYKGGIGEKGGLKDGDAILDCEGTPSTCPKTLMGSLQSVDQTKDVTLTVERAGKVVKVTLPPLNTAKPVEGAPKQGAPSAPGCNQ